MLREMVDPSYDDIKLAKLGDREALDRILGRNQDRLNRMAQRQLGDALRARVRTSDLLQSTYLEVVRGMPRFAGADEEAFVVWVGRILENNIRDKRRYFDADKRAGDREAPDVSPDAAPSGSRGASPSTRAVFGEELLLVNRAIGRLSPEHRQIIDLKIISGKSHKEAAEEMNRSEAAARVLLARARAALQLELEALRSPPPDRG